MTIVVDAGHHFVLVLVAVLPVLVTFVICLERGEYYCIHEDTYNLIFLEMKSLKDEFILAQSPEVY